MDLAYAVSDVVLCRAGASTISELCLVGASAILVPSPNVAEDHQTKNAMALVERDAALIVKDVEAVANAITTATELLNDAEQRSALREEILRLARPDATTAIANEVVKAAGK
jgi:UDP-N-acetylglucosamine--N-acetylmuramyl-(pentapeptide) pyrophosphoryl-undecaprenol N-acetylglucosamine transferase